MGFAGMSAVAAPAGATVSQELGVQIEEPFSILPLESIFDALQAAARARDSHRPSGSPAAATTTSWRCAAAAEAAAEPAAPTRLLPLLQSHESGR